MDYRYEIEDRVFAASNIFRSAMQEAEGAGKRMVDEALRNCEKDPAGMRTRLDELHALALSALNAIDEAREMGGEL